MIKNFSKIFALILTLIFSASYYTQTLTFSSTNPAVAPANVTLGSIKVPIYSAKIVASGFNGAGANLSSVSFTPTGTFLNSDITRYQFWYNTTNDLTTATNTGPDITAIPTQGTQVTLSPYNPYLGDGKTWYIWITADIKTSAVAGRTLTVGALSTSNFNFSSGSKTGTMSVGGTQTFGSDSDGDGVPDYQDLDSDNDGILDIFECPQSVVDVNFSVANGNSQTFSVPAADLGFIFDVYTLDNSFTLTVNGASISSSKLEFQPNQTDNVRFVDGSTYGNGTVPQIYKMTGTAANPLVRIIIHKNGAISMYGSKTSGGPLFPLQLYNGNNFNTIIWNQTSTNTVVVSQVVFGTTYISGRGNGVRNGFCDPDNDGISNQFDVDSDNDGCADAIEGSENVKYNQIHDLNLPLADPNYAYRGQIKVTYNGTTTSTPSGIISNSPSANGVPQLLNNAGNNLNASTNPSNLAGTVDNTDGTADIGQGIGDSQDNTINSCKCYKAPSTDGNNYPTQHGITAFNRAGTDNQNWPMVRQSGWTALEASTKGFVINRMPVSTSGANIGEPVDGSNNEVITSPIAGMMFYDTTNDCLKINVDGTRSGWKCFNNQSCPDEN